MRTRVLPALLVLLGASPEVTSQPLQIIQVVDRLTGLSGVRALVSSPEGEQVYALGGVGLSPADGSIAVFSRDSTTGVLSFREIYRSNANGFGDLDQVTSAVMAPDGAHLYVLRSNSRRITLLERRQDGSLRFSGELDLRSDPLSFSTAASLAISPRGAFVFVSLVSEPSILVFRRDLTTGALSLIEEEITPRRDLTVGPMVVSPDGRSLYAGSGLSLLAFSIHPRSGRLSFLAKIDHESPGGDDRFGVDTLAMSPDGKHLYTARDEGPVFILRRQATGGLSFVGSVPPPQAATGGPLAMSPEGAHLYACQQDTGRILVFRRDTVTGGLARAGAFGPVVCDPMTLTSDGRNLYALRNDPRLSALRQSLVTLTRQRSSGGLSFLDSLEQGEGAPEGLPFAHSTALSPNGAHVYALDEFSDQIGLYRRSSATGRLSFVESLDSTAESILLSPDGRHLYGMEPEGDISIFQRDSGTGRLTAAGRQPSAIGPPIPCCANSAFGGFSDDGRNLYAGYTRHDAIAVFQRHAETGQLTLLEVLPDGIGTPTQSSSLSDLDVSPDGRHIYLTFGSPGGVLTFSRDPGTGRLTPLDVLTETEPCFSSDLSSASDVTVSPDGRHVYVAALHLHLLSRDPQTGRLTGSGCAGEFGDRIAFSPDGELVYGVSREFLSISDRNPESGFLTLLNSIRFPVNAEDSPVVSPDGRNVYIPGGSSLLVLGTDAIGPTGSCSPEHSGSNSLCLNQNRFNIRVRWRDFSGNDGIGNGVRLTSDSGYFWFFSTENVELVVKVLDGRSVNGHFWIFYGALSNVEYTIVVEDTHTGRVRTYRNLSGQFASVADTEAFQATEDLAEASLAGPREETTGVPGFVVAPLSPGRAAAETQGTCTPGPRILCLGRQRFQVEVTWKDFSGARGHGNASPLTADTGYFWFFNEENIEIVTKVLDGRGINGHYWIFFGSLSSVEFHLTVTDTVTGTTKTYVNPSGRLASRADTEALPAE